MIVSVDALQKSVLYFATISLSGEKTEQAKHEQSTVKNSPISKPEIVKKIAEQLGFTFTNEKRKYQKHICTQLTIFLDYILSLITFT